MYCMIPPNYLNSAISQQHTTQVKLLYYSDIINLWICIGGALFIVLFF